RYAWLRVPFPLSAYSLVKQPTLRRPYSLAGRRARPSSLCPPATGGGGAPRGASNLIRALFETRAPRAKGCAPRGAPQRHLCSPRAALAPSFAPGLRLIATSRAEASSELLAHGSLVP